MKFHLYSVDYCNTLLFHSAVFFGEKRGINLEKLKEALGVVESLRQITRGFGYDSIPK